MVTLASVADPWLFDPRVGGDRAYITSRAARGGGGSFKNRKPIEKIRCCESQMSDQKH